MKHTKCVERDAQDKNTDIDIDNMVYECVEMGEIYRNKEMYTHLTNDELSEFENRSAKLCKARAFTSPEPK